METLKLHENVVTLTHAIGAIEADASQLDRLDEVTERLASGEFHHPTNVTVVCDCVDGRSDAAHGVLRPNSAGGSESLMVADDLTAKRFAKGTDGSTLAQYKATLAFLHESGQQIGGHTAEGVTAPGSGCGANDKLSAIYGFIAANGDALRDMAATLGVEVDSATQELIIGNAAARTEFTAGSDLLDVLQAQPDAHTALLQGKHREVVTVVNTRPGTTLDREALRAEFPDHQAFNLDAWALSNTAHLLTEDTTEVAQMVSAMVYYNLATACVLAGKSMRVVVVK